MKKFLLAVGCCMLIGMTACGSEEKVIEGTPTATVAPVQENKTEDTNQTQKANGYVFTYKDVAVQVDAEAAAYVEKLGEPASYYESPSCAFNDLDKFYTYHGFEIDTYYLDGKDLVLGVVLLDDTVSTTEGICIGDAQDKVASVYGEATETTENSATYKKDDMKLVFIFKDGVVASIEYKSLVLDAQ